MGDMADWAYDQALLAEMELYEAYDRDEEGNHITFEDWVRKLATRSFDELERKDMTNSEGIIA